MKAIIFGANGKLGSELLRQLGSVHDHVYGFVRQTCRLDNPDDIRKNIRHLRPKWVINASAVNNLEYCRDNAEEAWAINAEAPKIMAEECRRVGAIFVHFSTDYVFGAKVAALPAEKQISRVLLEDQAVDPIGIYGTTKWSGERAVLEAGGTSFVFRLSTLYGRDFSGPLGPVAMVKRQIDEAKNELVVPILRQQCGPTSVTTVAEAVAHVLTGFSFYRLTELAGLYHLATSEPVWRRDFVDFALKNVFNRQDYRFELLELPVKRPIYSYLDSRKFQKCFDWKLPNWCTDLTSTLPNLRFAA